jgi:hypothetical protein
MEQWFLVGNIPILSNAPNGRAVVGYGRSGNLERAVVAQPEAAKGQHPLGRMYGFFIWGGAPEHCGDPRGSKAMIDALRVRTDAARQAKIDKIPLDHPVWYECTMQQNPDNSDPTPRREWAYGVGWTVPNAVYFVVARSPQQRHELVAELRKAAQHTRS